MQITPQRSSQLPLRITFWILAIILGAVQTWVVRHVMDADGVANLDIADAFIRGDWSMIVNPFWSPLFPFLLSCALRILKLSIYWEFAMLHLVNFLIFIACIFCFDFFLRELIRFHRSQETQPDDWIWVALGYTLFIWSILNLTDFIFATPDILVSTFVFLAFGLLLRIHRENFNWFVFILFGFVLGLGYLARAYMFPLSFVFFGCEFFSVRGFRKAVTGVFISILAFLLIAGPFVVALRHFHGNDSHLPRKYLHAVNKIDWYADVDSPRFGTAAHPPKRIFERPEVYEFEGRFHETYPLHYDNSYWLEGFTPDFNLREYSAFLLASFESYYVVFMRHLAGLMVGFTILFLAAGKFQLGVRELIRQWILLLPSLAALSLFFGIHPAWRYISPFIVTLWLGLFSGLRLPSSSESRKWVNSIFAAMIIVMTVQIVTYSARAFSVLARDVVHGENPSKHIQWQVAEGLKRIGIKPGDKVASLGQSSEHYWARLLRAQIVAETPTEEIETFWRADYSVQSDVMKAFGTTEAKVLVAKDVPANATKKGWIQLSNTNYYAYVLKSLPGTRQLLGH